MKDGGSSFRRGFRDAIPIALGYFAVSFALGIAGKKAGLKWGETTLMSALNYTSAGEAAAVRIMAEGGSYVDLVSSTIVINLRYLLMSAAIATKLRKEDGIGKRLVMGFGITDEIFGISIAQKAPLNAMYVVGAMAAACPGWTAGTALGGILGEIMPSFVTNALSIALYAMFLAIIIPPARENKVVAALVLLSFASSFAFEKIPVLSKVSSGMKVVILTLVLSSLAAWLFPIKEEEGEDS